MSIILAVILQIARKGNEWTADEFLNNWGKELAPSYRTLTFEDLAGGPELPPATYLFTDLEIATQIQRALLDQIWTQLADRGDSRLFNRPTKAMGRYDLLRCLADEGINDFRVFRLDELPSDLRFPVFVRIENDHWGSRTPLIHSWSELDGWLVKAILGGTGSMELIVTEFCDTCGAQGLYRKFSAFCIAGEIVPRHIHFSRNWMLKMADYADAETLEEERQYMDAVPGQDEIRRIFEIAHIDYGRIDYAFKDGRIQVWEINTNPTFTLPEADYPAAVVPTQKRFAALILDALKRIDSPAAGATAPIRLEPVSLL